MSSQSDLNEDQRSALEKMRGEFVELDNSLPYLTGMPLDDSTFLRFILLLSEGFNDSCI